MRTAVTACTSFSVDSVRDAFHGSLPEAVTILGVPVRFTACGAGRGKRPLFVCPTCQTPVLLLFTAALFSQLACRKCWRISYDPVVRL